MADELVIVPVEDHRFSRDVLEEGSRLARSAPERVTDWHLQHLAHYCSDRELTDIVRRRADAVEKAEDAFAVQVHTAQQRAIADTRAAAAPAVYTGAPSTDFVAKQLEGMTLKTLCATYPDTPMTLGTLGPLAEFVDAMNERNKERNAKIAALETHAAGLQKQLADLRVELDALLQVRQ